MCMKNWTSETEARQDILNAVADYYRAYKKTNKTKSKTGLKNEWSVIK